MEIEIRKVETYICTDASAPVKLNVEEFKKCNPPFKGSTEEEFMDYLYEEVDWLEDFVEENKKILSEDNIESLDSLIYPMMDIMYDSRNKGEDSWYEIGKTNPEYRRSNEFEVTVSGNNY